MNHALVGQRVANIDLSLFSFERACAFLLSKNDVIIAIADNNLFIFVFAILTVLAFYTFFVVQFHYMTLALE